MHHTADFFFHGALQDFLPRSGKANWQAYDFTGAPAIKDAIEAMVAAPEADSNFGMRWRPCCTRLWRRPGGVYPADPTNSLPEAWSFCASRTPSDTFVLDVHLGKLAKALRLLGFDTCYQNDYSDQTIAQLAAQQNRIVLTRDVGLLKQKVITWGYWLRSQHLKSNWQRSFLILTWRLNSGPLCAAWPATGTDSASGKGKYSAPAPSQNKAILQ